MTTAKKRERLTGFPARTAIVACALVALAACGESVTDTDDVGDGGSDLDASLMPRLAVNGVDGRIEEELEARLGRPIDDRLAELGRLLFFDRVLSLTEDNSCAGCHGPNVAFNDPVPISIGVDNNGVVGEGRLGPHNRRRAPSVLNAAFYPRLMWDNRFSATSLDPFDSSRGFVFPEPDGDALSRLDHLLAGQAFTPVIAPEEMAGDFPGDAQEIRAEIASRVDAINEYRQGFGEVYPGIAAGDPLTYDHIATALAEFQFTLVRADAPIDRYARGDTSALTPAQKRGGMLFFTETEGACLECHIALGYANQMFSDFHAHNIAVPQVNPVHTNVDFDGPEGNEDFGLERVTGDPEDRYKFRTSPLRNVAYQPSFMHNGAFVCLRNAISHHTDVYESLDRYSNTVLPPSLRGVLGPVQPMLARLRGLSATPRELTERDIDDLVAFMHALSDPDADPGALMALVPPSVPSGLALQEFEPPSRAQACGPSTGRPGVS